MLCICLPVRSAAVCLLMLCLHVTANVLELTCLLQFLLLPVLLAYTRVHCGW